MKVTRTITASVMALGLVVGLSGFAGAATGTISTTGPDSYNKVKSEVYRKVRVKNDNDLKVGNNNNQQAYSGDAKVKHNTTGGSARTGTAANTNTLNVSATVRNSLPSAAYSAPSSSNSGTIRETGPDSTNIVSAKSVSKVSVKNDNDLKVYNNNNQTAVSGDAKVVDNTTGGSAVSGDARNTNNTTINFSVTN